LGNTRILIREQATVRVNRALIKLVKSTGGDFNDYRLYVIARAHFASRSGIFAINELLDLLNLHYGYKSLHRLPGNDRKGFLKRLLPVLASSVLFTPLSDGRYKANSERKLLSRVAKAKRSGWYEFDDINILLSRRLFADFCVGCLLAGNKFRANKNISNNLGCTVRRVQFATSRNHKASTFFKQYNYVEEITGSFTEVMRHRAILLNVHGISSPQPFYAKERHCWILRLNAPNSYRSIVLSGVKGHKAQPPEKTVRKEDCWFIPKRGQRDEANLLFKEVKNEKLWTFNERLYDSTRYIRDHSKLYQEGGYGAIFDNSIRLCV
jgi:hypothetical protein